MNLSINNLRKTFIPKGNGIVRKYNHNIGVKQSLNAFGFTMAAGGITALITKNPYLAGVFAGLSFSSATLANYFNKNANALKNNLTKFLQGHTT